MEKGLSVADILSVIQVLMTLAIIPILKWAYGLAKSAAQSFVLLQVTGLTNRIETLEKSNTALTEKFTKLETVLNEILTTAKNTGVANMEEIRRAMTQYAEEIRSFMKTGEPWTKDTQKVSEPKKN